MIHSNVQKVKFFSTRTKTDEAMKKFWYGGCRTCRTRCVLPAYPFPKSQKLAYFWINSLKFYTACFYCMLSQGLSKYIENVIADVKSKINVSRPHFFADVIFSATSKVQNYQNKTGEKSQYSSKYVLTTYFKEF